MNKAIALYSFCECIMRKEVREALWQTECVCRATTLDSRNQYGS